MIANKEIQGNLITVESLICESSGYDQNDNSLFQRQFNFNFFFFF